MAGDSATIRATLARTRLTNQWPPEALAELAAKCILRHYRDNERMVAHGEVIDALWIVTEGTFVLSRTWQNGRRFLYSYLRPGQCTGLMPVFDNLPAVFDVIARGDASTIICDGEPFRAIIRKYPDAALKTMAFLSWRTRTDYEAIELHAMNSVRCRIAKSLLWIARGQMPAGNGELAIDTRLSQEDLADIVCAARQSVNRELRRLMKEGVIRQRYRAIVIADRDRLIEVAGEDEDLSLAARLRIDTLPGSDLYPTAD